MNNPRDNRLQRLFEEALDRPQGLDVPMEDMQTAQRLRFVLYRLRQTMRKTGHPRMEEIDNLAVSLHHVDGGAKAILRIKPVRPIFDQFTVIDRATGENLGGKFKESDELVEIKQEDLT